MKVLIITALLVAIIVAVMVWKKSRKNKGYVVLGSEKARADQMEQIRLDTGHFDESPISDFTYKKFEDDQSLINPIENELDHKIAALCERFFEASEEENLTIRNAISQDEIYTVLQFVRRATVFAIRTKNVTHVWQGFYAIAMVDPERCDYRDVLVALGFAIYGAERLHVNYLDICPKLEIFGFAQLADLIRVRVKNIPQPDGPDGYKEITTRFGIGFVSNDYKKYKPQKNLVEMLLSVSAVIGDAGYTKGDPKVGDELVAYRLMAAENNNIKTVIMAASGCASITAYHKTVPHQRFTVQLAEYEEPERLKTLEKHAAKLPASGFARLVFVQENIICLAWQGCYMQGGKDIESTDSIKRFKPLFSKAIADNWNA